MFSRFTSKSATKLLANPKIMSQTSRFEVRTMQRIPYDNYDSTDKILALEDHSSAIKPSQFQVLKSQVANLKQSTRNFIQTLVSGSKSAYYDARYASSVVFSKPKQDRTVEEISEISRIKTDLKKFVPFYSSMVLPGGFAMMFLYLYLCPRGIPTYFMKPQDQLEKQQKLLENQARAHELLKNHLLSIMRQKGYKGTNDDTHNMIQFLNFYRNILLPKLKPSKLSLDMLRTANDFVMVEYVEGTYIINKVIPDTINLSTYLYNSISQLLGARYRTLWDYSYYNRSFHFERFPMSIMKKTLLKNQFKKKLNELKAEDNALLMGYYGDLKDESAIILAKERGFDTTDGNEARKWLIQNWKVVIEDNENNQVLSFWESVVLYRPQSQ